MMYHSAFKLWEGEKYYHINTWFPFSMNNFFLLHFRGHISSFSTREENCIMSLILTTKLWSTAGITVDETHLKYAFCKCSYQQSGVITQPDKKLSIHNHHQHKQWQRSKLSAEYLLIFVFSLPYVLQQPCCVRISVVVIQRVLWYLVTDSKKLMPEGKKHRLWVADNNTFLLTVLSHRSKLNGLHN